MALLEQGVYHEPDLLPPDSDDWAAWGLAQLERIFFDGAEFDLARARVWMERVQEVTGIDASAPLAILDRSGVASVVPVSA